MTLLEALNQGALLLEQANIPEARRTAQLLLAHAVRKPKEWLYAHSSDELIELWWIHYGRYLHERIAGKPVQYITQVQEFYGRDFRVTPAVLIPRPETEHLIEAALAKFTKGPIVDVGTGSGAIAETLRQETAHSQVFATDISWEALEVARGNSNGVHFIQDDLLACFQPASMRMIVSNPPYIPIHERESLQKEVRDYEPHLALFGGESGFDIYVRLIAQAEQVLMPKGWLLMELAYNGADEVQSMLEAANCWTSIERFADLAGHTRVIAAQLH